MKCKYCNRRVRDSVQSRIHHMVTYHRDKTLGMGLRIAADPFAFGQALGDYVKDNADSIAKQMCKGIK